MTTPDALRTLAVPIAYALEQSAGDKCGYHKPIGACYRKYQGEPERWCVPCLKFSAAKHLRALAAAQGMPPIQKSLVVTEQWTPPDDVQPVPTRSTQGDGVVLTNVTTEGMDDD